jgi:hypothetical protein
MQTNYTTKHFYDMRKSSLSWIKAILFGCAITMFAACDDSNEPSGTGEVEFEITDAPIDDANVKGVFVTVADIKVDGKSVSGFTKQTIDLKAYQDGNTKFLGSTQMAAKSYSTITLVLDVKEDENGNEPGCYVLSQDNSKYRLKSTADGKMELALKQFWKVRNEATTKIVMDFDLRKSLRYDEDPLLRYSFVSDANLKAAVRVVEKENSGTIKGTYQQNSSVDADRIVVYAYKKGTFNASTETQAQGEDQITFKNAIASAQVKQGLTGKVYTLAYLPEGDYELHFAAYNQDSASGRVVFSTMLKSETSVDGAVANVIRVNAATSINISSTISGTL